MTRTLIAGFGNVLCGDDGFGVEVIRKLHHAGVASETVKLLDVGIGGIHLPQELLGGYDRLIVVDAMQRDGEPGAVYVRVVESVAPVKGVDMHLAVPSSALSVAQALGVLPCEVYLVGCEPAVVEEALIGLSPVVAAAVDVAVERVRALLPPPSASPAAPPARSIGPATRALPE